MDQGMFHGADGYDRLIGRYLPSLAPAFAEFSGVDRGRVLDVGCGPGGLTSELARRLGAEQVFAIDPSPPFVEACRQRVPGATVAEGVAEHLPYDDGSFDAALSSLVVGFMTDAPQGVREMRRVTRGGGVVALCFWDHSRMQGIARFWEAARRALGVPPTDDALLGTREGDLVRLLERAGLVDVEASEIVTTAPYRDAEDLWSGYTARIGPIGQFVQTLDPRQLESVRAEVREGVDSPDAPFTLSAVAWAARGTVVAA